MIQFVCTHNLDEEIWLCPLSVDHDGAEVPDDIGSFANDEGRVFQVIRVPAGFVSYADDDGDALAHYQRHIKDIVQNCLVARVNDLLQVDEPMILADGKIYRAKTLEVVVRITMRSLSEHPDFLARMSILKGLYEILGIQSDVNELTEIASAMTIEEGMCMPITDENKNPLVMTVGAATSELGCFNVTLCGTNESVMPFQAGHKISRITTWKVRGSTELYSIEVEIGEIV